MSLTNSQVHARFFAGETGVNGCRSMQSRELSARGDRCCYPGERVGVGLYSYGTLIAVRRDSDGQVFRDSHRYPDTSSQHQPCRQKGAPPSPHTQMPLRL